MRKLVYILSIAALACCFVACNKSEQPGEPSGPRQNAVISIACPEAYTKALGDGTKASEVYYTAFVGDLVVPSLTGKAPLVGGQATLQLSLVQNVTYNFVFWAQPEQGQNPVFDLTNFNVNSEVKVYYQNALANDDLRDAFCANKSITVVKDMPAVTVYLKRPFSQINFCSSDYDAIKYLGLHTGLTSEMYVTYPTSVPDVLKVLDGSVKASGQAQEIHFALAAIPSGEDEYITIQGTKYGYVGMNYVLASEVGETVVVEGGFKNGSAVWETGEISNVPVKRNYKTNIVGELFVEHGKLQIIVQPEFNTPDELVTIQ